MDPSDSAGPITGDLLTRLGWAVTAGRRWQRYEALTYFDDAKAGLALVVATDGLTTIHLIDRFHARAILRTWPEPPPWPDVWRLADALGLPARRHPPAAVEELPA
jgi:hypothetical protein